MTIKVLYFSSIKDKLKKSSEEFTLNQGATLSDLIKLLKEKYPYISENLEKAMFAVNEEYVDKSITLKNGDIVAVIPPVSGG